MTQVFHKVKLEKDILTDTDSFLTVKNKSRIIKICIHWLAIWKTKTSSLNLVNRCQIGIVVLPV